MWELAAERVSNVIRTLNLYSHKNSDNSNNKIIDIGYSKLPSNDSKVSVESSALQHNHFFKMKKKSNKQFLFFH